MVIDLTDLHDLRHVSFHCYRPNIFFMFVPYCPLNLSPRLLKDSSVLIVEIV